MSDRGALDRPVPSLPATHRGFLDTALERLAANPPVADGSLGPLLLDAAETAALGYLAGI